MRPQKKEQKRVQAMINEMEVGDTVLTTSGFYGVLIDISDEDVIVEFGSNKNCRIPMQKAAIAQVEKGFCRIKDERRESVVCRFSFSFVHGNVRKQIVHICENCVGNKYKITVYCLYKYTQIA